MTLIATRPRRARIARALCAATLVAGPGGARSEVRPIPRRLEACIRQRADAEGFSGVVAAAEHGRSLAMVARGERAGSHSAPITPETRFNIGSASKMFTAVAIGQLIDAGKLRLDDPLGTFVAGLTPAAGKVTIRQLLTHTSGMGNFFKPENFEAMERARSASDILPLIVHDSPEFPPGDHFEYSNSGFALLGVIVERVSGQTYGQYLHQHVFAPAGMANTSVDPEPVSSLALGMTAMQPGMPPPLGGPTPGGPPSASSQRASDPATATLIGPHGERIEAPRGGGPAPGPGMVLVGQNGERMTPPAAGGLLHPAPGAAVYGTPAGGVFSSAVDIQRFMAALMSNRLTKPETTAALTTLQVTPSGTPPGSGYGFGFGIRRERGREWVGHNGGTLGANAEIFVDKSSDLSVTVITNRDPPYATRMFAYIKDLLAQPDIAADCKTPSYAQAAQAGLSTEAGQPAAPMTVMQGPPSPPDAVDGEASDLPMTLTGGVPTLEVQINGKGPFRLTFDTGAPGGPHLSERLASALGLQPYGQAMIGDPSGRNATPVKLYRLESVAFGAISARGWLATAAPPRRGKIESSDGVVGLGAFAGFVVTIDYPRARFGVRRGALPPPDGRSVFSYEGQMAPAAPLTLEGRTILAHVDTGNSVDGVIVPAAFAEGLRRKGEATAAGLAHTVSNTVQMYSVPVEGQVRVGSTPLAVSAVEYPSIIPVANIGSPALAQAVVEVDPANARLRIRPAT